jgi:hypothetical protein
VTAVPAVPAVPAVTAVTAVPVRRLRTRVLALAIALGAAVPASGGEVDRIVVVKLDGLSHRVVDRAVRQRNARTGKSALPWIDHVFYQGGTRLSNFYVRGMSLSGPSWSLLDTGQHLQIRGNVEFDRYTQRSYDYLNFIPFWLNNAMRRRVDMWGTSVLDDIGVPLLLDAYGHDERYQSFQLFQRGSRWVTLSDALQKRVTTRGPKELFDEWRVGIDGREILTDQLERELIAALDDPGVRYLDYYTTEFDHDAHHNRDWPTHLAALQKLDALVGRIWTAIAASPQASRTVLVVLSDHGVNSDELVYSQGFSLVDLLGSAAGGGHHVVTKRRPMTDYSIKGIYPLVPLVATSASESPYLTGQSSRYPTAILDFDGNERASIHLRHSVFNMLHVLLQQLQRTDLAPDVRRAGEDALLAVRDAHRTAWRETMVRMREELAALQRSIDEQQSRLAELTPPDDEEAPPETSEAIEHRLRLVGRIEAGTREAADYHAYLEVLERLVLLERDGLRDADMRVERFIPPGAMGERNSLFDLQHYVTGPGPDGLVLASDGSLDLERSFARMDYFDLLTGQRVRNNVQRGLANTPVDFVAMALPCESTEGIAASGPRPELCLWLDGGDDAEALLLGHTDHAGRPWLRYLPVAGLAQGPDGTVRFTRVPWREGLPLALWEDPELDLPAGISRGAWLGDWHSDAEWLRATHRTVYSNAVVGLHEQMAGHHVPALDPDQAGLSADERLVRRFRTRQRALVEPDLLVLASDHWNFDVRGFNPGGNHGSFFRTSTHSTWMMAGGERTGVPRGLNVETPYDSLSFVPTVLALTGGLDADGHPSPALRARGFRPFPGPVVEELFAPAPGTADQAGLRPDQVGLRNQASGVRVGPGHCRPQESGLGRQGWARREASGARSQDCREP